MLHVGKFKLMCGKAIGYLRCIHFSREATQRRSDSRDLHFTRYSSNIFGCGGQDQKPLRKMSFLCQKSPPIGWYLAVLFFSRPRSEGWPQHGRILSPFISVLCHSAWLFHGESCPRLDVVHPGRAWSSSPACTWRCSCTWHIWLSCLEKFDVDVRFGDTV